MEPFPPPGKVCYSSGSVGGVAAVCIALFFRRRSWVCWRLEMSRGKLNIADVPPPILSATSNWFLVRLLLRRVRSRRRAAIDVLTVTSLEVQPRVWGQPTWNKCGIIFEVVKEGRLFCTCAVVASCLYFGHPGVISRVVAFFLARESWLVCLLVQALSLTASIC